MFSLLSERTKKNQETFTFFEPDASDFCHKPLFSHQIIHTPCYHVIDYVKKFCSCALFKIPRLNIFIDFCQSVPHISNLSDSCAAYAQLNFSCLFMLLLLLSSEEKAAATRCSEKPGFFFFFYCCFGFGLSGLQVVPFISSRF